MPTRIPNGYARRVGCTAKDVDARQLKLGTQIEMEHTRDRRIARQIALDHLCENKGQPYYVRSNVKHDRLLLPRNGLGAACSRSSRITRGIAGGIMGGVVGGVLGLLVGGAVTARRLAAGAPGEPISAGLGTAFSVAFLGLGVGAVASAWAPEC